PEVRCIVASGGFEVETSEFDKQESYDATVVLTATAADSNAATGGLIVPGTPYVDPCCGVVSRGVVPSGYGAPSATGRQALSLWTIYLPQLTEEILDEIHPDLPAGGGGGGD